MTVEFQKKMEEAARQWGRREHFLFPTSLEEDDLVWIYTAGAERAANELKEQAVKFLEWAGEAENPFLRLDNGRWVQACGNSTSWTTQQLFDLFLQQKQSKNE